MNAFVAVVRETGTRFKNPWIDALSNLWPFLCRYSVCQALPSNPSHRSSMKSLPHTSNTGNPGTVPFPPTETQLVSTTLLLTYNVQENSTEPLVTTRQWHRVESYQTPDFVPINQSRMQLRSATIPKWLEDTPYN